MSGRRARRYLVVDDNQPLAENLAEIGCVANTARRHDAAEPVTGPGQTL